MAQYLQIPSMIVALSECAEADRALSWIHRASGIDDVIAQAQRASFNMIARSTWSEGKLVVETVSPEDFYEQATAPSASARSSPE